MQLYNHQQKFLDENPNKSLLCWGCGTGKTIAGIKWAELREGKTLFIMPKSVKEKWRREIKKFSNKLKENNTKLLTKEEFRKQWDDLSCYENIVVDECQYFSGMRNARNISQMAKSLFAYTKKHNTENIILMTGTAYSSTPFNIYMLARILGHNWNYQKFKYEFFEEHFIGMRTIFKPREGIENEMAELVQEIGSTVLLDDCVDVPDQVDEIEFFNLNDKQIKEQKLIIDTNPAVKYVRYHQIENGSLKGDGYTEDKIINCEKTNRIIDLCNSEKKVAVVCRYNLQIKLLSDILSKSNNIYVINGETKDKDEVVQQVENEESCVVLINAMASEGYELPSVNLCVFASMSFALKDHIQMRARFLRINKLTKNVFVYLLTKDGVDEAVYEAIQKKTDFHVAIYAG